MCSSLNCLNNGPIIATPGKKLSASISVNTDPLKRNRRREIAYAVMMPKIRQKTVVSADMVALFLIAPRKIGSLKIWRHEVPVRCWGQIVGGEANSSSLVIRLILRIQSSGSTLTRTMSAMNV